MFDEPLGLDEAEQIKELTNHHNHKKGVHFDSNPIAEEIRDDDENQAGLNDSGSRIDKHHDDEGQEQGDEDEEHELDQNGDHEGQFR